MSNYYLGGDASKGYCDFTILDENKKTVEENFQLDDTFAGHNQLYEFLKSFFNDDPSATIYAALESTGGYENNWINTLEKLRKEFPIYTARLNPFGVNHDSKASLTRVITDSVSAKNIAEYQINHSKIINYQKEDYFSSLRKGWTHVKLLVKQKAQLLNQLEAIVYTANPEILKYSNDGFRQWTLKLLKKYPTAQKLSRASSHSVSKIPYISLQRAEELIENAKKSVASANDVFTESVIISTVDQILNLEKVINKNSSMIAQNCYSEEVDILLSFKGIGDYSAIGLLLEIGAIERFSSSKKLASFFGLHPVYKKSGDGVWGIRMSKKGRKIPRELLFNVAKAAIVHNPHIREIYEGLLKRGMNKMAAIGVLMHKILRIIYGMLKNKEEYNPQKDIDNREKFLITTNKSNEDKSRRYQSFDEKAPISRRQKKSRAKTRKAGELNVSSQNGLAIECGINTKAPIGT